MNTTHILRHINALRCLRLLRGGGGVSRAEIARALGLTRSTVGYAVRVLLDAGLVAEVSDSGGDGQKGRPGVGIALDRGGAYSMGIDVGTRVLTCVLIDLQMGIVEKISVPTGSNFRDPGSVFEKLVELANQAVAQAGIPASKVQGICVSVPGLVDRDGRVINAPYLEWRDYPLREKLVSRLPSEWIVGVRNDAVAFASAECAVSTHTETENLLVLLLAEGVGSALVHGGRIIEGAHGYAGEVGHTVITANGRTAPFELLAGAPAFAEFFGANQPVSQGVANLLKRLGEVRVDGAVAGWADSLAMGLANTIHAFDPGKIVLGGPLASLYPYVADRISELLREGLLYGFVLPPIVVTQFGSDGAAIGAAAIVRENVFALPDLEPAPAGIAAQ